MHAKKAAQTTGARHREDAEDPVADYLRSAARRKAAEAPPLVPGTPVWDVLAAAFAAIPDTTVVTERGDVTGPVTEGR